MVPRETGRREFLLGAAGATGVAEEVGGALGGRSSPAVGVPGLRDDHRVRWEFAVEDEKGLVYPAAGTDDVVFAHVNHNDPDSENQTEVHAVETDTGETRWKTGEIEFPVATSDSEGLVYARGAERIQALDVADGSVAWEFQLDEKHLREFGVAGGAAFVATGYEVTALDAADGTERWQISVGPDPADEETTRVGTRIRGLTVADGTLYFGSTEGFTAVSVADGERRWHAPIEENAAWPGEVRDDLLVGWSNGAVYAVEVESGDRRFRTEVGNVRAHGRGGTVGEGSAYVWGDRFTAVDLRTGGKRWTYADDEENRIGSNSGRGFAPVVSDGLVITSTGHEGVVALDADSGRERWKFDSDAAFGHWGEVKGGFVYVTGTRRVHALDTETGREEWSLEVSNESATTWVVSLGDAIFVGTRRGRLYAIDPPSRLATAPVETATEFATTSAGLGFLGLLGAGLLGVGYRHAKRRSSATNRDADLELGRLACLDSGPVTETYLKRVQTPDGPRLVAETRLTESPSRETRTKFAEAVENWADLDADGPADSMLPVRDYGTDPEPWFETPYLAGGSLADSWPLSYRERVEVASAVARALHAAHREAVVHGQLAPRHILRGIADDENRRRVGDPEVRVGGWFLADALAEAREASGSGESGSDESDPYAPPEVRDGDESAKTVAGDVYRVGALAHHLLTGAVPSPSSESELASTPESGSPAVAGLPDELGEVLNRALADDPEARHDSALAFDDEFRWAALDR